MPEKSPLEKIASPARKCSLPFLLLDSDLYLLDSSEDIRKIVPAGSDKEASLAAPLSEALEARNAAEICGAVERTGVPLLLNTARHSVRIDPVQTPDTRAVLVTFLDLAEHARASASPLLEAVPDPAFLTDGNDTVTGFNAAACHFFLALPDELRGVPLQDLLAGGESEEAGLTTAEVVRRELTLPLPARGPARIVVEYRRNPGEDGRIVILRDRTRESSLEAKERASREKLAVFNDNLRRLTSLAAHDMKEPLVVTSIYAELLLEKNRAAMDQESVAYVGSIMEMVRRMVTLIDNLVALVRMDTTRPLVPVDASVVCDEAVKKCRALIEKTGVKVARDPLPQVMGNKILLTQLFYHLISNAVKFSAGTSSEVKVTCAAEGDSVRVSVIDKGAGFESAHAEKVFELFERFHDKETYPGFGTGLTLAKKIAAAHGGKIWAESAPGKGAAFHFTLKKA